MIDKDTNGLIDKLAVCQAMCNHCFNACLNEEDVKMMKDCIKLDKDCAEICSLAISSVASQSSFAKDVLQLCAAVCDRCAEECGKHDNSHCRDCAKACKECAEACREYIK